VALSGAVGGVVRVAQPLQGGHADGAVEAGGPEGQGVAQVLLQHGALHLPLPRCVQHGGGDVGAHPGVAVLCEG